MNKKLFVLALAIISVAILTTSNIFGEPSHLSTDLSGKRTFLLFYGWPCTYLTRVEVAENASELGALVSPANISHMSIWSAFVNFSTAATLLFVSCIAFFAKNIINPNHSRYVFLSVCCVLMMSILAYAAACIHKNVPRSYAPCFGNSTVRCPRPLWLHKLTGFPQGQVTECEFRCPFSKPSERCILTNVPPELTSESSLVHVEFRDYHVEFRVMELLLANPTLKSIRFVRCTGPPMYKLDERLPGNSFVVKASDRWLASVVAEPAMTPEHNP